MSEKTRIKNPNENRGAGREGKDNRNICPSGEAPDFHRYVTGEMSEDEAIDAESHLLGCEECLCELARIAETDRAGCMEVNSDLEKRFYEKTMNLLDRLDREKEAGGK